MLKPISEVGRLTHIIGVWRYGEKRWGSAHLFFDLPNGDWTDIHSDKIYQPEYFAPLPEDKPNA